MKFQIFLAFFAAMAQLGLIQEATVTEQNKGNLKFQDTCIYIRKQFTAGNTNKLIDGRTEKVVGITNIDGNKLEKHQNIFITHVSLKYGVDASVTDAGLIDYNKDAMPNVLRNAELVVRQSGRVVFSLPISALDLGRNASPAAVGSDRYELSQMALINDASSFEINIEFPDGSTTPAGNNFVEVNFFGVETYYKA